MLKINDRNLDNPLSMSFRPHEGLGQAALASRFQRNLQFMYQEELNDTPISCITVSS